MSRGHPFHDLREFQSQAQKSRIRFCNRPLDAVERCMGFEDVAEARDFIREAIAELTLDDFVKPTILDLGDEADVYGWKDHEGRGWYIKFAFSKRHDRFEVVSFHPPEHDLFTRSGRVLTPWEPE